MLKIGHHSIRFFFNYLNCCKSRADAGLEWFEHWWISKVAQTANAALHGAADGLKCWSYLLGGRFETCTGLLISLIIND